MRNKGVILILVVVVAVGLLISAGMEASTGQQVTVKEALTAMSDNVSFIQIESNVDLKSIVYNPEIPRLNFDLIEGDSRLPVVFEDVKPDNFDSGYPVIVEGRIDENGTLQADKLLVKCPSKYEEEELEPGTAPGVS